MTNRERCGVAAAVGVASVRSTLPRFDATRDAA